MAFLDGQEVDGPGTMKSRLGRPLTDNRTQADAGGDKMGRDIAVIST